MFFTQWEVSYFSRKTKIIFIIDIKKKSRPIIHNSFTSFTCKIKILFKNFKKRICLKYGYIHLNYSRTMHLVNALNAKRPFHCFFTFFLKVGNLIYEKFWNGRLFEFERGKKVVVLVVCIKNYSTPLITHSLVCFFYRIA